MSSVTFSTTVGGDGSTVTDDDNATTGLGNGGSLIRLVPMMQQSVNVASYVVSIASGVSASAAAAAISASNAAISASSAATSVTQVNTLGAATGLQTTGSPVIVNAASPPTAGQALVALSATTAAWGSVGSTGGQIVTTDITLTSSSTPSITFQPTKHGYYATLPNATTCTKNAVNFSFYNDSEFYYGVKNSSGQKIGWIPPKKGVLIGLSDNATANGAWTHTGLEKIGITASKLFNSTATLYAVGYPVYLDANRVLFLSHGYPSANCYGVIYDKSTDTWGNITLIRTATITTAVTKAVLVSANKVLCVSCNGTTGLEAVVLSISGTTITVNTAVTATLAGNIVNSANNEILIVGTSFIYQYSRDTTVTAIRSITVSGTTPVIGSELALSTTVSGDTNSVKIHYSGSGLVFRTIAPTSTSFVATPVTVSGTTLTAGTTASITTNYSSNFKSKLLSNGNILAVYYNTNPYAAIFKLTGTTEAVTTVQINSYTNVDFGDGLDCGSGKFILGISNSSTEVTFCTLTDTAGTISKGTNLVFTTGNIYPITAIDLVGTTARFLGRSNINTNQIYKIDVSSTSASLISAKSNPFASSASLLGQFAPDNYQFQQNRFYTTVNSNGDLFNLSGSTNLYTVMLAKGSDVVTMIPNPIRCASGFHYGFSTDDRFGYNMINNTSIEIQRIEVSL